MRPETGGIGTCGVSYGAGPARNPPRRPGTIPEPFHDPVSRSTTSSTTSTTTRSPGRRPGTATATRAAKPEGAAAAGAAEGGRRRRRGRKTYRGSDESDALTSLPTSRRAYTETREWLLGQHGPVCAYCAETKSARTITLDHVTPRRGQTAYDRRDNLVLACRDCNAAKRDMPLLSFLLARRSRAASLLRYGQHLSPMLRHLAGEIAGPEEAARAARLADPDYPYAD